MNTTVIIYKFVELDSHIFTYIFRFKKPNIQFKNSFSNNIYGQINTNHNLYRLYI